MIRVACPHCGRTFRTMTEGMGKTAVCSGCSQPFRIGSARPKFAWKETSLAEDSWVGVDPPAEKKEIKHCIMCDAPLEDGAYRCLACGANQVTGLVHKRRAPVGDESANPIWSLLPWRTIAVLAFVGLIGGGVFWGVKSLFTSVAESGVEMARHRLIMSAARHIADGGDEAEFVEKFGGHVDDETLPRYLKMLEAGDPMIRRAAAPLIASGHVTQVEPIVEKTQSEDEAVAAGALGVLEAIGPRRLVDLSCDEDATLRRPAAEALCRLFDLQTDEATLDALSEPVDAGEKIARLNEMCRPWPRAVGTFAVFMGDESTPVAAEIKQVGHTFYLHLGPRIFTSDFKRTRTFEIPVEQWCAATGVAVDPRQVGEWLTGRITLTSPYGIGWEGNARVTARKDLAGPPPGFLPVPMLGRGETVELPIVFEQ